MSAEQPSDFQTAFFALSTALKTGDLHTFYGLMHDEARLVDEDVPFLGSKDDFKKHIEWHVSGIWEAFEWKPRHPRFTQTDSTGAVVGYSTFRGKPIDAGYRQRHMFFSQGWSKVEGKWLMINWHQSTLDGHILGISPG
jgi:hypothetical protein